MKKLFFIATLAILVGWLFGSQIDSVLAYDETLLPINHEKITAPEYGSPGDSITVEEYMEQLEDRRIETHYDFSEEAEITNEHFQEEIDALLLKLRRSNDEFIRIAEEIRKVNQETLNQVIDLYESK